MHINITIGSEYEVATGMFPVSFLLYIIFLYWDSCSKTLHGIYAVKKKKGCTKGLTYTLEINMWHV